jgi:hypothetical protein
MQIGGEHIENLLVNMKKKHKYKETPFHVSLFGNGLNIF